MTDWIAQLCDHAGIGSEYRGFNGEHITVSRETRAALLPIMGHEARSDAAARDLLLHLRQDTELHPAQAEVIVFAGEPAEVALTHAVEWAIEAEGTATVLAEGSATDRIPLPALPLGIHRLIMVAHAREWVTWVLARPARATSLADRTQSARVWGVTAPIYGLTDGGRAAIGSYGLLGEFAAAVAAHGADFVGINPVHAMGKTRPDDVISPYSPSHREFLNTWHANTDSTVRGADLIDYPAALAANDRALQAEFARFQDFATDAPEIARYEAFVAARGTALNAYALFEVLADAFGADWQNWPAAYRNRDAAPLATFAQENASAIAFCKWSQWRADCDLAGAQARAIDAGMRVGLYLDLAVGPRLGGAETWFEGSSLVTGATLGAPPDPLAPAGQRWGLAPQSPLLCRTQGYAGFARLMRSVMRHAGMIRIDHILGLMRSFWIPDGHDEGAYVIYPVDAMLAVVAIESARSGVVVIGEDLGLVPEGLRDRLATSGIYGLDVLQYMRSDDGGFVDTANTREKAICAFSTHDTPTIAGFFGAEDAKLHAGLGALDTAQLAHIESDRMSAFRSLNGNLPIDEIHSRLARARSEIVAVQLDDTAGCTSQQNLPGTVDEYPNWRRATPVGVDDIKTSAPFANLGDEMRRNGRANSRANPTTNGDGS